MLEYFRSKPENNGERANYYTTLLAHIHGLFSFKLLGLKLFVIVMQNVMPTAGGAIDATYDLKGSWRARNASPPKLGQLLICAQCGLQYRHGSPEESSCRLGAKHTPRRLLKDNDLTFKVLLPIAKVKRIKAQLRRDVDWLARMGIMDYSLLLGAQRKLVRLNMPSSSNRGPSQTRSPSRRSSTPIINNEEVPGPQALSAHLMEGPSRYYIGIIDYLQTWTVAKRLEQLAKMYILGQRDKDGINFMACLALNRVFIAIDSSVAL